MKNRFLTYKVIFIKLGGSVITNKKKPFTLNKKRLQNLIAQIKEFKNNDKKGYRILLGHGSGSFGHAIARKYNLKHGKNKMDIKALTEDEFFVEKLNRIVYEECYKANLPAMSFSPRTFLCFRRKNIVLNEKPLLYALKHDIIPIVYGDNILCEENYFYLLSTEDIFRIISSKIRPCKIILVSDTLPFLIRRNKKTSLNRIDENVLKRITKIKGNNYDITGGMIEKIKSAFYISKNLGIDVIIVNGTKKDSLKKTLLDTEDALHHFDATLVR